MSAPSLLIVPARLKAGKLFSQIPTNGNGDFTVVQAVGNATRVNSLGLIEKQNTNLAFNSGDWRVVLGGEWVADGTTISSGSSSEFLGPLGGLVANAIKPTTATGTHSVYSNTSTNISYTSGVVYTMSGFFKAGSGAAGTRIQLTLNSSQFGQLGYANFNLVSGIVTVIDGGTDLARTAQIQSLGDGWYRCSFTATCNTSGSGIGFLAYLITSDLDLRNPSFNGVATDVVYGWGAQVEANRTANTYIPTTTGPATAFCGVVQNGTTSPNIPRLDYYTSSGTPGCPALLVEPASTNFVPSGTTFSANASASITATSTSPAVDISGTIIAKSVTGTTTLYANQTCLTSLPSGSTTYTISRFFKYNGTNLTTSLEFNNGAQWGNVSWRQQVVISAASGVTLGTSTACTGSVENYGNGWYRVSARFTTGATPSGAASVAYLMLVSGSVASGSSFLTALPQLEVGSVATSYIPTTTGSVTRNADVISVSGAVSGSIGQTEGTIYAEVDVKQLVGSVAKTFVDIGVANNRIFIGFTSLASNTIRLQIDTSDGSARADIRSVVSSAGIVKIAAAYKSTDCLLYVNGVSGTVTSNSSLTFSALNAISLGKTLSDTAFLNDRIRAAALYTTRLTNDELMLLTMPGNNTYLPDAIWEYYLDSRTGNTEIPDCLYTRHVDLIDV